VVLLSPGLNYFNELPTEGAVQRYRGRSMLVVASSEDLRSVETVEAYRKAAPGIEVKLYENAGHGTDILDAKVGLDAAILAFLKKSL
jgi:pimeloyl-ACP methyl ester carboxylesterase